MLQKVGQNYHKDGQLFAQQEKKTLNSILTEDKKTSLEEKT